MKSRLFCLWLVTTLPLLALARKQRALGMVSSLVLLPVLSSLILGGLYQTLGGQGMDLGRFSVYWPYFLASTAFVAGVASWELELLSGLLQHFQGRSGKALWSRALYVLVASTPMFILFLALRGRYAESQLTGEVALMVLMMLAYGTLGSAVALKWGFGGDKGINNIVQVATWIFALGPSPFFPRGVPGVRVVFPTRADQMNLGVELAKIALVLLIGILLSLLAMGPRRKPVFSP